MGYDEAFEIPSEDAVTLSLRTQQIIALETGIARTADPLAGSYFVEHLTDEIEARARSGLQDIEEIGGAVRALEIGLPQRWITEAAYQVERDMESGKRPKVGVNVHVSEEDREAGPDMELFQPEPGIAERQIARLTLRKAGRDQHAYRAALQRLRQDTADGRNVMPSLIEAARSGATVGEMSDVFRRVFGEFREPSPW
jgi:methylmalonyl-CoA mutase N-terminal domain/subunit